LLVITSVLTITGMCLNIVFTTVFAGGRMSILSLLLLKVMN
jgi:hypothetical protein